MRSGNASLARIPLICWSTVTNLVSFIWGRPGKYAWVSDIYKVQVYCLQILTTDLLSWSHSSFLSWPLILLFPNWLFTWVAIIVLHSALWLQMQFYIFFCLLLLRYPCEVSRVGVVPIFQIRKLSPRKIMIKIEY